MFNSHHQPSRRAAPRRPRGLERVSATALAALALLASCGPHVDEDLARRQFRRGHLDAVEAMLEGAEGEPAATLRRELDARRERRAELVEELALLRDARGSLPDDQLQGRLEELLDRAQDEFAREQVRTEISSAADWFAARRQGGVHVKANLKGEPWRRERAEEPAPEVVADPLLAAVLEDAQQALEEKSYRRAVAIAEMAMEDAPSSAPAALALRDAAVDAARRESRALLEAVVRLRAREGTRAAIARLAEERWRFPDQGGGKELNAVLKELRAARAPIPVASVGMPDAAVTSAEPEGPVEFAGEGPEAGGDARADGQAAKAEAEAAAAAAAAAASAAEDAAALAAAEAAAAEYDRLTGAIVSSSGLTLDASFEEFYAHAGEYESAWTALEDALETRMARTLKRLGEGATLDQIGRVATQRRELDARRERALELIFDTEKYFYPYRPPAVDSSQTTLYYAVQREVDELVAAVREVWDAPRSVAVPRRFRAALVDLAWLRARPDSLGDRMEDALDASDLPEWVGELDPEFERVGLHDFAWDAREREQLRYSNRVRRFNEGRWRAPGAGGDSVRKPAIAERDQVRVTNDYRVMLGRRAIAWNARLQEAARGHSVYMADTGEFGHYETRDPARRTPYDRMRLEGYTAGASENCYVGTGDAMTAHEAWLRSSGHHRNILGESHTELGSGLASSYWTQNFGQSTDFEHDLDRWQD